MSSPRCPILKRTLDDFIRVLKPGGELILVNHIGAESGPRRVFELAFAPLARRLGWRPEFPWARLVELGGEARWRQPDRAAAHAADGAFLTDPLPQILIFLRNIRPGGPFSPHADEAQVFSFMRAVGGVRSGERTSAAGTDHAAGPHGAARGRPGLRADPGDAAGKHYAEGHNDGSKPGTVGR